MEDLKIKKQKAKLFNIVKSYYSILDDLAARLQKDYAGGDTISHLNNAKKIGSLFALYLIILTV